MKTSRGARISIKSMTGSSLGRAVRARQRNRRRFLAIAASCLTAACIQFVLPFIAHGHTRPNERLEFFELSFVSAFFMFFIAAMSAFAARGLVAASKVEVTQTSGGGFKVGMFILAFAVPPDEREAFLGCEEEMFHANAQHRGLRYALLMFWWDVTVSVLHFIAFRLIKPVLLILGLVGLSNLLGQ